MFTLTTEPDVNNVSRYCEHSVVRSDAQAQSSVQSVGPNIVTPHPGSQGRMLLVFNTDDQEAPAES